MTALLIAAALKATVVLFACATAAWASRHRPASFRHAVWVGGLVGAVLVFALPSILPSWRVIPAPAALAANDDGQSPVTGASQTTALAFSARSTTSASATANAIAVVPSVAPASFRTKLNAIDLSRLIIGLWIAGAALVLSRYVWGHWVLHRLASRATHVLDDEWMTTTRTIGEGLRLGRAVRIVSDDELAVPLTWGIARPYIGVPADALQWTEARRRHVLQHELAHVKRRDAITQTVAQVATSMLWFHPLVWYAARRMRQERERACDDEVLRLGTPASDYAGDLLAVASTYGRPALHSTALAMAHQSQLEGRLLALLDPTLKRGSMSRRHVVLISAVAVAIVVPLSAMTTSRSAHTVIVEDASAPMATPLTVGPSTAPVAPTPTQPARVATVPVTHALPAAPQSGVTAADIFATCTRSDSVSGSESSHSDGATHKWSASWKSGDCGYEMKADGRITFNRNVTAIDSIAVGGSMDVTTDVGGDVTHLVARQTGAGIEYAFTHNGAQAPFDAAAAAWFAGFLQALDRQTAFAIDLRFPALLQEGGAARVFQEIPAVSMGYGKARYLERLIQSTPLSAADVDRALELIATIRSDYETGQLLVLTANRFGLNDAAAQSAYLRAVSTLSSDHTIADALSAFVAKVSPTSTQTELMLTEVLRMHADYEIARVLVQLADKKLINDETRASYLEAAMRIRSVYERNRAMSAIAR